jgi:hypothetical protein
MRTLRLAVASLLAAFASPLLLVTPAEADQINDFTLTESSVAPGDTVTATATWTATTTGPREVVIVIPAELGALGAVWNSLTYTTDPTPTSPVPKCVFDTPPTEAACEWEPVVGEKITLTATFEVPDATLPKTYELTATENPTGGADVTRTSTLTVYAATPAVSISPTSASPGSIATLTGTFTAKATGDIRVGVYLLGTDSGGTFGTATSTTGLEGCTLDSTNRAFSCTWPAAKVGDTRTIVIPVNVASTATVGLSWTGEACSSPGTTTQRCASTPLAIVAPATASPTPTATATPSATATPTATPTATTPTPTPTTAPTSSASSTAAPDEASTTEALPTAVPAGEGPADPSGNPMPVLTLIVAVVAVAGGAWFALTRRSGDHQV